MEKSDFLPCNDVPFHQKCRAECYSRVEPECPGAQEPAEDGKIQLHNPHLEHMEADNLYHLALATNTHDLKAMFGDVKFICMGGTPKRMEAFAHFVKKELDVQLPTGADLYDICHFSYRYCMYKVGPVLSVSHGMGAPSLSILMHEMFKLVHYAECKNPVFVRIGTSGGIGVPPGSVVVSTAAMNGLLKEELEVHVLGEVVRRPCVLNARLAEDIAEVGRKQLSHLNIVLGKTMCANDFYEEQGRLDGAFCHYTEAMKFAFLEKLRNRGVVNVEMEATQFASMCHHAGVKGAIVCVTLLDRVKGDQITTPKATMMEWQERPQQVVIMYIKKTLGML